MLSYKIKFYKTQYNQYKEMTCNVQDTEIRQFGSEYKHLFGNNRKFLTRKCSEELSQRRHLVRMVEWNTVQWTRDIHAVSPDKHGSRRQRQAPELASARLETTQECNVTTTAVNTDNKQHNP